MSFYRFHRGQMPVLMSIPHLATAIPPSLADRMTDSALGVPDTDWDLDRLYDFTAGLGLSILTPVWSRYAADLNRPPDDSVLYPGAFNTGLVPMRTFSGDPIYLEGQQPAAEESAARRDTYWRPYHDCLQSELDVLRARCGEVVLFDCHSIRSRVPALFEGRLADFNLGTAGGRSCDPGLRRTLAETLAQAKGYTLAVDGRFKGGYITRHYGDPENGVHAFQLELSQATYAEPEVPYQYSEQAAAAVRPHLRAMMDAALRWLKHRSQTRAAVMAPAI